VKRLLVVSNGYGEDIEVAQVIRALPPGRVEVLAYPLVGLGHAYPPGTVLLEPRREFPSGGFGVRFGPAALWADVRHGWLGFWTAQRRTLRSQRGGAALTVAAGDVYCLWMAAAAGSPVVYLALPRSEYVGPHTAMELWVIRRAASLVFTRDEMTAAALRRHGVRAEYRGFTLMDTLHPTGETFGIDLARPVLTLLPGSKPAAFDNLILLLRAAAGAASGAAERPAVLVAWAPNLPRDRLRAAVEAAGGRWADADRFDYRGFEVCVTDDHFSDALTRATVVLGMAGAAHEQAAGLGKPVVTFPGHGPQVTARFLREQQRLLGEALVLAATPEEGAAAASSLLREPAERERRGRVGRERQGGPGGSSAIAQYLVERLSA
jgi:uncharacterized protein (TIGR03492 family)